MRKLYSLTINGHVSEWFQLEGCYMVRIDGLTDLSHQGFAWTIDSLERLESRLLGGL